MKFIFTKHAKGKFSKLAEKGFIVSQKDVLAAIQNPNHIDADSDFPKIIASRATDDFHIIRVVYKIEDDIITIITFYPAQRGRYYEEQ